MTAVTFEEVELAEGSARDLHPGKVIFSDLFKDNFPRFNKDDYKKSLGRH